MPGTQEQITGESFSFQKSFQLGARRKAKVAGVRRKRGRTVAQGSFSTSQRHRSSQLDNIDLNEAESSPDCADILVGVVLYIDKTIWEEQRLARLAVAMGARISEEANKSVTHIVHAPMNTSLNNGNNQARLPKLVQQALERSVRVISPQWVVDCYEQKKRVPEIYYPFDTDGVHRLNHEEDDERAATNDNPFGLDETELGSSSEDEKTTTTTTPMQISTESETTIPEHVRQQRRQKRSEEIAKILRAVRQSREKQQKEPEQENEPPIFPETVGPSALGDEERLEIWYGEQSFYYSSPRRSSARKSKKRES